MRPRATVERSLELLAQSQELGLAVLAAQDRFGRATQRPAQFASLLDEVARSQAHTQHMRARLDALD